MATAAFANPVISVLATPPGSPVDGDRYLVAGSGTSGVFVGKENQVAERSSGAWGFSGAPAAGQQLSVGQLLLQYNAGWKLSPANVFDTVTALLVATAAYGLADGVSFRCAGRASAKDGGGADFYYDASDSSTADNGGTVRVDGASHRLKAKVIDPRQLPAIFGMVADGTADDKTAFQAMVNWAYAQKIRDVYLPRGDIALSGSVFVPYGIMVRGQLSSVGDPSRPATRIVTRTSASYTNGFMLGFNTADNSTQSANANYYGGGMEDVCFYDVANLKTAKGIAVFGNNYEFRNVGGRFMLQILKRGGLPTYSDNLHLFNPYYSSSVDPTVAQFEISGSGDGLIIDGGNFPPDQSLAISLVYYTQGACYGGVIRQCINGSMYIDARNITIENWHAENSTLKVDSDAYVLVVNSSIAQNTELTAPVIQMIGSFEGGNSNCLELDNVSFRWQSATQFASTSPFDVSLGQGCRLVIRNCRRTVNGTNSAVNDVGIRVGQDDNTTPVPGWKSYADLLSRNGEIMPGYNVVLDHVIPAASGAFMGPYLASAASSLPNSWKIATGTYYYRAVRMYDVEKRIGTAASADVSTTISNTSSLISIAAYCASRTSGAGPVQGMTRFYRGTASGSYNAYADVPLIATDPAGVVDNGDTINGVPWISRAASGIDTIYPPDMTVPWRVGGVGLLLNGQPIITSPGNAATTLGVASEQQVIYGAALTAARTVTLPALGRKGDKVRVTRTAVATGAFNVTVAYGSGGGSTATIAAPTSVAFADLEYNGTYWDLMAKATV